MGRQKEFGPLQALSWRDATGRCKLAQQWYQVLGRSVSSLRANPAPPVDLRGMGPRDAKNRRKRAVRLELLRRYGRSYPRGATNCQIELHRSRRLSAAWFRTPAANRRASSK